MNLLRRALPLLVALPLLAITACSSGDDADEPFEDVVVLRNDDVTPIITTYEFVLGENRFALGLLDDFSAPIVDANVHFTFYDLNDGQQVEKFQTDARVIVPARDAGIDEEIVHIHPDGSRHLHVNRGEEFGIYTATVNFDRTGPWGVVIDVESDRVDLDKPLTARFDVQAEGTIPGVGEAAPPSENLTADDVEDLAIIDTSSEPTREMHEMTIAEAVESGKPTVVLFAAPGYCTTQTCGPSYEILKKMHDLYKQQANFIHVEFYENPGSADPKPVEAAKEWRLPTEPWFFVIDSGGIIKARFEGPTGLVELEEALQATETTLAQP